MPLTLSEIAQLQTGDRVRVTWSGGNGPHNYTVVREPRGAIVACAPGLPPGYPGTLYDPDLDARAIKSLHIVERL